MPYTQDNTIEQPGALSSPSSTLTIQNIRRESPGLSLLVNDTLKYNPNIKLMTETNQLNNNIYSNDSCLALQELMHTNSKVENLLLAILSNQPSLTKVSQIRTRAICGLPNSIFSFDSNASQLERAKNMVRDHLQEQLQKSADALKIIREETVVFDEEYKTIKYLINLCETSKATPTPLGKAIESFCITKQFLV